MLHQEVYTWLKRNSYHRLGTWQYKNDYNYTTLHDLWPWDFSVVWSLHALQSEPLSVLTWNPKGPGCSWEQSRSKSSEDAGETSGRRSISRPRSLSPKSKHSNISADRESLNQYISRETFSTHSQSDKSGCWKAICTSCRPTISPTRSIGDVSSERARYWSSGGPVVLRRRLAQSSPHVHCPTEIWNL